MDVASGGEVIVPRVQDVGSRAVGVIGFHDLFRHGDGDGLRLVRLQQGGLGEANQLHGGLFHPVGPVVVGVGGLHIDLHHVLAGTVPGVGYGDGHLEAVLALLYLIIRPVKPGVGQAVAEGELDSGAVVIVSCVSLAQHRVLIPGLIIAVAHIDALGIHQVLPAVGDGAVGDGVVPQVGRGGGAEGIVGVGVHQPPGGVDLPGQGLADGVDALLSHAAAPQAGLHVGVGRVVQEAQLQGVVAVEYQHHRVESLTGHGQQIQLILVQLQVAVAGGQGLGGNVRALAAAAPDADDGRVAVLGEAVLHGLGVDAGGHLVHREITLASLVGDALAVVLSRAGEVEVPQGRVHLEAGLLQCLLQVGRLRGVHRAGARAAVDEVHAVLPEDGHRRPGFQGQGTVLVLQQHHALLLNLQAQRLGLRRGDGARPAQVHGDEFPVGVRKIVAYQHSHDQRRADHIDHDGLGRTDGLELPGLFFAALLHFLTPS